MVFEEYEKALHHGYALDFDRPAARSRPPVLNHDEATREAWNRRLSYLHESTSTREHHTGPPEYELMRLAISNTSTATCA